MSILDSEKAFSGTKPVDARYKLDSDALSKWLDLNVDGYEGPLSISQFKGGQSNPTYKLEAASASYVLRRKPDGVLLPSAHAIDREYRVMSRLYHAEFAVPRTLGFCDDATVLGFEFYVMSMEEGCVFWDGRLPQLDRMTRRSVYVAEIETLADLHDLDPASLGLGDFGSRGNYCARQISRWIKQYRSSETKHIPAMERLVEWLPRTVPEQAMVSIVHGDYRLNNLIFEADAPRVKAVLDWELATLGDPLADFTNLLIGWVVPCDGRAMIGGVDFQSLGIPTLEEAIQIYCDRSKSGSIPNINWYLAYNLFRLAAIMQGIAGRSRDGTASSPRARQEGETATALADAAWEFAGKAGA